MALETFILTLQDFTGDVTAPVLSAAVDTAAGATGSVGSVTTDKIGGFIYAVITTSATTPTAAQIIAGEDHTGADAVRASRGRVREVGVQDYSASGLLANTQYFTHFVQRDDAYNISNAISGNGFTTGTVGVAPVLSSPIDAADGATASTGSVTTDSAGGVIYWVITTSATSPSAAQVRAGLDNAGATAADQGTQVVALAGTYNMAGDGLSGSTNYFTHFMHENVDSQQSNVASASGFTTEVEIIPPVLSNPVDEADGQTAFTASVTTNEAGGTLYWVVSTDSTTPTALQVSMGQGAGGVTGADSGNQVVAAAGVQNISDGSLTADTQYFVHFMHEDADMAFSNVVSGDGFTTAAATGGSVSNKIFDYGVLSDGQAGGYTVVPDEGVLTSLVPVGPIANFEAAGTNLIQVSNGHSFASQVILTFTANFADASTDTFTATINPVADAASVRTWDEMRAYPNSSPNRAYGQEVLLRPGVYNGDELSSGIGPATVIPGNVEDFITFRPHEAGTAFVRRMTFANNNGFTNGLRFRDIDFEAATTAASELIRGQFGGEWWHFELCRFSLAGALDVNSGKLAFRAAENGRTMSNIRFDRCMFDNLADGVNFAGNDNSIVHCIFSRISNDCTHSTTDGTNTPNNYVVEHNVFPDKQYAGGGLAHGDYNQLNWSSSTTNITGFVFRNNVMLRGAGVTGESDGQGLFGNGAGPGNFIVDPIIENNFYSATFGRGISVPNISGGRVVGNTVLFDQDPNAVSASNTSGIFLDNCENVLVADNIANVYSFTGSTNITQINNQTIAANDAAYQAVFANPLNGGALTAANVYASYANIGAYAALVPEPGGVTYSTIGGTAGTGSVDHPRSQSPTGLNFTDLTGVPVSTLQTTSAVQLTSIGANGAVARIAGDDSPEFRIRNAADDADVVAWRTAPAIIDNNERIQLRETSSASASTLVSSTATVGLTSDQWDITTAAGGYVQNRLDFTNNASTARLQRAAALLGPGGVGNVADTKQCTVSARVSFDAAGTNYVMSFNTNRVRLIKDGTEIQFILRNAAGTGIYQRNVDIGASPVSRFHFLASVDLNVPNSDEIYIDGVQDGGTAVTFINDTIGWNGGTNAIGARPTLSDRQDGEISDLMADNTFIDFTVQANRERFILGGNPVDPGPNAATAFGAQPVFAMVGNNAATVVAGNGNVGYGGAFTVPPGYVAGGIVDI